MPRSFPIFQFPNRPLIATIVAAVIARGTHGRTAVLATTASRLALLVWAAEEIFDGANWFRRLLGMGGATLAIAELGRTRGAVVDLFTREPPSSVSRGGSGSLPLT